MKTVIIGGTGYIGSRVFLALREKHRVDTVDLEWFGNYVNPENIKENYGQLPADFWQGYDAVILFAGHSSVPMCIDKMLPSFDNNVREFVELLEKIGDKKLIYASSSSVYGNTMGVPAPETWKPFTPSNFYDLTKKVIDLYSQISGKKFYGLRMGTLAGCSPNLRVDIMINKMYHAAKTSGKITVFNPEVYRPILGMDDMCRAVSALVEAEGEPGIYNLASFNANVDEISRTVAASIGNVEIVNTGNSPTYNFSIDTQKFEKIFNFRFKDSIQSIVDSLKANYDTCKKGIRE